MQSDLNILFLDDHPGLRDGTALLLSKKEPRLSFFCAGNAREALERLKGGRRISIALVDLNLDGEDGLLCIKELRAERPDLKVIVYTMYSDPFHIRNALLLNIQGYVTKNMDVMQLLQAIRIVQNGGSFFSPGASLMVNSLLGAKDSPPQKDGLFVNYALLSKSEQRLFELLAQKKSIEEIKAALGKKEKTVLNNRTKIYQKMGFKDRLDLIEAARTLGVIE